MSLYIRLQTSFWTHRKTLRLRARLGEASLWLLPRLWSYAAENQPDGNFSSYSADEMALLLGYSGDAQAMLVALQEVGWMDGMSIHDWQEHNGYHQTFSERAKKAADARWKGKDRKRQDKKGKDKRQALLGDANSNALSIPAGIVIPQCFAAVDGFILGLAGWVENRRKLRKPATEHAIQLMVNKLAERPQGAIAALNKCILSGWQGFEWEWLDRDRQQSAPPKPNGLPKLPGHR